MFATILAAITALLQAIPIFAKYFPPKSPEKKVEEGHADLDKEQQAVKDSGRPKW